MNRNAFSKTLFLIPLVITAILAVISLGPKNARATEQPLAYFSRALTAPQNNGVEPSAPLASQNSGILSAIFSTNKWITIIGILLILFLGFKLVQLFIRKFQF